MEVLIGSDDIQRRVREIGKQIARDHPEGTPLLIGVLRGCVLFVADLMKSLSIPHEIDFVSVSSYEMNQESSGRPRLMKDIGRDMDAGSAFASAAANTASTRTLVIEATGASGGSSGRFGASAVVAVREVQ